MRITDEGTARLARDMFPTLERVATCRATGNHRVASNDEPELFVDRGPLTVPAELTEEDAFAAFDLARNVNKAQRWHERNDSAAVALDLQHLDAMRRAGL